MYDTKVRSPFHFSTTYVPKKLSFSEIHKFSYIIYPIFYENIQQKNTPLEIPVHTYIHREKKE